MGLLAKSLHPFLGAEILGCWEERAGTIVGALGEYPAAAAAAAAARSWAGAPAAAWRRLAPLVDEELQRSVAKAVPAGVGRAVPPATPKSVQVLRA